MGSTARPEPLSTGDLDRTAMHVPQPFHAPPDEPTVISRPVGPEGAGTVVPAPSHELSRLLAGERLGHYELLEFAGGGGMGAVFRARDSMLQREVAIKVLSRDQAGDDETLKRFKHEAQSAARLDHDNIARVYYVGEDRGLNYIVFEYIEGMNVRQLVDRKGPLPTAEAVSYVLQVADALSHAAARDVVHRDIKPSNIVITSQGKAKLVDMGLARFQGLQPGGDLTASGVTLGTFDYISPEQARDPRTADVRSDIYSLGCTLYFMLTGRPPFPEGTVLQKLLQHNSDDPIDPREFNPDLPDALTVLLRKMLAKDPHRRYQTPTELIADLLHLAEQTGLDRGQVRLTARWTTDASAASPLVRHLPWLVPVAGLVLAFFAWEVWENRSQRRWREAWSAPSPPLAAVPIPDPAPSPSVPPKTNDPPISSPLPTPTTSPPPSPQPTASVPLPPPVPAPTSIAATANELPLLPPPREGVLVVCDDTNAEGRYASLRAACFAARNGDVVELCYNGPRIEKPLVLNNLKITIRAGQGFRPCVRFRPGETVIPNAPHAMLTVVGGPLDIVGCDVDFDVPAPHEVPADRWSLFDLQQAENVHLDRTTLTIRNAMADGAQYHPEASVFAMSLPPGVPSMMMNDDGPAAPDPVEIRLENCIVRGEAALLRSVDSQGATLYWNNGLAALADSLLAVRGGATVVRNAAVRVDLQHLTAVVGGEGIRLSRSFEMPHLPAVVLRCSDGLIASLRGRTWFDYDGFDPQAAMPDGCEWSAERVVYDGIPAAAFWRRENTTGDSLVLSFDDWKRHWGMQRELQTAAEPIPWLHPLPTTGPLNAVRPGDFALNADATNPRVLNGAADGFDLGAILPNLREPYGDK